MLDAQPESTIPYTAMEATAVRYSTPASTSARYSLISYPNTVMLVPQGMTAQITIAGNTVMIGASTNITLSARSGISSSLKISLMPSAIGCNSPAGPARFGPMRVWMRASTRRSISVR